MSKWFEVRHPEIINSPALLVFPRRVKDNIDQLISYAGEAAKLRPHIKTVKSGRIIELMLNKGISKFKCTTIAEAELLGMNKAPDVLISYPIVKAAISRFIELSSKYPKTKYSIICDNILTVNQLDSFEKLIGLDVFIDLDVGMHRTGISNREEILELAKLINSSTNLKLAGVHVYDGHIHDSDIATRDVQSEASEQILNSTIDYLISNGISIHKIIAGGTPSLMFHRQFQDRELGAGTPVLWDYGYQINYEELNFDIAAVILCRVISKPTDHFICLDLGYKAVASEMPWPRAFFPQFPSAKFISHSEEHLVLDIGSNNFSIGDVVYAFPTHICPTVALNDQFIVIENGEVIEKWPIEARKRAINI